MHPLDAGEKKCCFCCKPKWKVALYLIAIAIILYGIISYIIWAFVLLLQTPSAIYLYIEFPAHATVMTVELIYAEFLGFLLLLGLLMKIRKLIIIYAWCILFSYVLALGFIGVMIYEGPYVIDALIYNYFGKEYVVEGEERTDTSLTMDTLYYLYMVLHLILLVSLATYVGILSLSYIQPMRAVWK